MRAAPRDIQNVNAVEITSKPIQVWLRRPHLEVTCRIVLPDGATMAVGVMSLSLLDAQTEITSWLTARGYEPVSPWRARDGDGCSRERTFAQSGGQSSAAGLGESPADPAAAAPGSTSAAVLEAASAAVSQPVLAAGRWPGPAGSPPPSSSRQAHRA